MGLAVYLSDNGFLEISFIYLQCYTFKVFTEILLQTGSDAMFCGAWYCGALHNDCIPLEKT